MPNRYVLSTANIVVSTGCGLGAGRVVGIITFVASSFVCYFCFKK